MKRGKPFAINVQVLEAFHDGDTVSLATLIDKGLISKNVSNVKILASGEIKRKLTVKGITMSASAREKIEKAGGTVSE